MPLAALVVAPPPPPPHAAAADPARRVAGIEARLEQERTERRVRRGAAIFSRACAACHGRQGEGDGPAAVDLDPRPRDLTTRRFRFRSTPSGELPRPEDLERTVRRGIPGSAMPAFGDLFSDDEVAALVAYVFSRQPVRAAAEPAATVVVPPVAPATPRSIAEGHALYLLMGCWRCHGVRGDGKGPAAKGLTDEAERPIRSTDFRYDPFKGGREPRDVVRALITGLNGAPMPSYSDALLFAREDLGTDALEGLLTRRAEADLRDFLERAPTRERLARMDEADRAGLRDERLAALAHHVLSLDRRRGLGFRLFRQRPEREARSP